MKTMALSLLAAGILWLGPGQAVPAQPAAPPNIVVILADDMGYGDPGSFGSPNIKTPRLDAMVAHRRSMVAGRPLFDELLPAPPAPAR